jgi:uracil-DNA glycosylase family 4
MPQLPRPAECSGCPLNDMPGARGFMVPDGLGTLGVMAIAEALGQQEADEGLPLRPTAPAGGVWHRTIKRAGLSHEQLVSTNMVHCQPPKNLLEHQWYETEAVNHCKVHMDREVEKFQPRVMLAMGNVPLKYLTGYTGSKRTITNVRGFYLEGTRYSGIPVVGTYHPSYIQRDKPNLLGVYRLDLLRAVGLAKLGGRIIRPRKVYTTFPPLDVAKRFLADCRLNPDLPITYDIETVESISGTDESDLKAKHDGSVVIVKVAEEWKDSPEHLLPEDEDERAQVTREEPVTKAATRITQIQFSIRPGEALVIPYEGDYISLAREIMALPNPKWGWNVWGYDDPLLMPEGFVYGGISHDMMWAWHHLQPDLPRGLQYATSFFIPEAEPWKHRSQSDPGDYGGDDVNYLRGFGVDIMKALDQRGLRRAYDRHIVRLNPILNINTLGWPSAAGRGIPMDTGRLDELGAEMDRLRGAVDMELQEIFPDALKNIEPKQGYKNPKLAEKAMGGVNRGLKPGERWIEREFDDDAKPRGGAAGRSGGKAAAAGAIAASYGESCASPVNEFEPGGRSAPSGSGQIALPGGDQRAGGGDPACQGLPGISGPEGLPRAAEQAQAHGGEAGAGPSVGPGEVAVGGVGFGVEVSPILRARVRRWARMQPFLPNSSQQILAYIKWKRQQEIDYRMTVKKQPRAMAERNALYVVPKKFREDKETTEKKELIRLGYKTKDPFFDKVIEHREYGKLKSTYVVGWAPREDTGCVHTTFLYIPATGQLSSRGPNAQNAIKGGDVETPAAARKTALAKKFRACVKAQPGKKIVEVDMTAFHALTLGFEARDPDYMRLARLDIHSFNAANILWLNDRNLILKHKLPPNPSDWFKYPDEELAQILKVIKREYKVVRDKRSKPAGLAIGFGLGAKKLFDMNRKDESNPKGMESLAEAKKIQDIIKGLFPKVFKYQDATRELAHRQGNLYSLHGYQRWFFDVYHWDSKSQSLKPGKDSEAAIAFRPANNAFGMIKEQKLELDGWPGWDASEDAMTKEYLDRLTWSKDDWRERSYLEKFGFINQIHDALVFHCETRLVEECLDVVCRVMTSPSRVLVDSEVAPNGLVCGVEADVGDDWAGKQTVRIIRPKTSE